MKVIAVVLTKNEEKHIGECVRALDWADAVLVSDSHSTDSTCLLAREAGARVVQRAFDGWANQRNAALETAAGLGGDWVLFVDADERPEPALAVEVRRAVDREDRVGWWVPRHNIIVGKEVRHAGFYPDYQLRLLRVGRARYDPAKPVHEVVLLDGEAGHLTHHLVHYNYDNWAQFHGKQRRYATMEAQMLSERGIRPRPHNFVLQPLREFRRRYLTLQGYRDGLHGLKLCLLLAYYYGFYPYWVLATARS